MSSATPASVSPRGLLHLPGHPPDDERLTDALAKYQSDGDLARLRNSYDRYRARSPGLEKSLPFAEAVSRGFSSFSFSPAAARKRYLAVKNRTDADAIRADWEAVGDYLSYAITTRILDEEKADE